MPPQKPKEGIQVGKFILTYRAYIVLCLGSYTPFGQAMMAKIGLQSTSADIESIKVATMANKAQVTRVEEKLTSLISEFETMRRERNRTAGQ